MTGARPIEMMTDAAVMMSRPPLPLTGAMRMAVPTAAMAIPMPMIIDGRYRWMILGAMVEPTMKPAADGSDQKAASIGDSPRTSCRNCEMNRK